ncbi:basic salivary proline-rich protein 2-like [Cervus elaphus]|uniref:basic salivary proline-rich protein 2-like n=1 Tax=Cervus elaphus TaxID=9860 RepID=UPI001CC3119A|nr:basic salivary proline-rich protein 2-like [Cervus elaphus]
MRSGRVCGVRTDRAEPGEVPVTAGPESTKQQGDSHGGPGPGAIRNAIPAGAPGPWPAQRAREPGSRERPKQPGGGEERAGRPPGPGDGPNPPRAGKEDPGAPPAAQRLLCRAKDFRSNGLGPPGEKLHQLPARGHRRGRASPARSPPRARPGASAASAGTCGRRTGARPVPELGRGAQGSDVRAPGPPPQRTPAGSSGAGDHRGAGREESPPPGLRAQTCGPPGLPRRGPQREAPGPGITEGRGGRSPPGSGLSAGDRSDPGSPHTQEQLRPRTATVEPVERGAATPAAGASRSLSLQQEKPREEKPEPHRWRKAPTPPGACGDVLAEAVSTDEGAVGIGAQLASDTPRGVPFFCPPSPLAGWQGCKSWNLSSLRSLGGLYTGSV